MDVLPDIFGRAVSHPSAYTPLQSTKPALQVATLQELARQVVVATWEVSEQTIPQPPQLFLSVVMFISQPSIVFALQFAKPLVQARMHWPALQPVTVALLFEQGAMVMLVPLSVPVTTGLLDTTRMR